MSRLTTGYSEDNNRFTVSQKLPKTPPTPQKRRRRALSVRFEKDFQCDQLFLEQVSEIMRKSNSIEVSTSSILKSILDYTRGTELFFIRSNGTRLVLDGAYCADKEWSLLQKIRLSKINKLFSHNIILESKCNEKPFILNSSEEVLDIGSDCYTVSAPESILCIPIFINLIFVGAVYISNDFTKNCFTHANCTLLYLTISNLITQINQNDHIKKKKDRNPMACQKTNNIVQDTLFTLFPEKLEINVWEQLFLTITEGEINFYSSPFESNPIKILSFHEVVKVIYQSKKSSNTLHPQSPRTKSTILSKKQNKSSSTSKIILKLTDNNTNHDKQFILAFHSSKLCQVWFDIIDPKVNKRDISCVDIPSHIRIDSNEIVFGEIIGRGAVASVYSGNWKNNSVAIKKFFNFVHASEIKSFMNEIQLLHTLQHPNIVGLFGGFVTEGRPAIVCELVERGSLDDVLYHSVLKLSFKVKISFIKQIAEALHYLHSLDPPIIHRDLKPGNILVKI